MRRSLRILPTKQYLKSHVNRYRVDLQANAQNLPTCMARIGDEPAVVCRQAEHPATFVHHGSATPGRLPTSASDPPAQHALPDFGPVDRHSSSSGRGKTYVLNTRTGSALLLAIGDRDGGPGDAPVPGRRARS